MPITARALLLLLLLAIGALLAGCGSQEPTRPPDEYRVRVLVKELSGEGEAARVRLHHEALPEFKDQSGKVVGMEPMVMAFGLAEGVERSAFAQGAKLEVRFECAFGREPMLRVLSAAPLPPETELELP